MLGDRCVLQCVGVLEVCVRCSVCMWGWSVVCGLCVWQCVYVGVVYGLYVWQCLVWRCVLEGGGGSLSVCLVMCGYVGGLCDCVWGMCM